VCSIIRPTSIHHFGAVAAVNGLAASNLFLGQSDPFFDFVLKLAREADEATRKCEVD
jgi:hypothetical protein